MKVNMEVELNKVKEAYAKKYNTITVLLPLFTVISIALILTATYNFKGVDYSNWGKVGLLALVALADYNMGKISQKNYLATKEVYFNLCNALDGTEKEEWLKAYDDFVADTKKNETTFDINFEFVSKNIQIEIAGMLVLGILIGLDKLLQLGGLHLAILDLCYNAFVVLFLIFLCDALTELLLNFTIKDVSKP